MTGAAASSSLRVIIGAGEQRWGGWIPTGREDLDLLDRSTWEAWFGERRAAARLCFEFLQPGGLLRVAVPDAHFPDPEYQRTVQVGGPGPADHPAADHRIVYTYRLLADVFRSAGFEVDLLEYCDEAGRFHFRPWDLEAGPIYRSLRLDPRNRGGHLRFVSLILDARKPPGAR